MKLVNIILSQAIRFIRVSGRQGGSIFGPELFRGIESRYGFFQGPRALSDFDTAKGITFLHGHFHNRFVVDKLQLFANGLLVEAKVPVEECDVFIDDLIEWATKEIGLSFEEVFPTTHAYMSQLEVESPVHLEAAFGGFKKFCDEIVAVLHTYGQHPPEFGVSAIRFHGDISLPAAPKPVPFAFERREGSPYDSGLYFSSAPVLTKDHMKLLEGLEAVLSVN